MLTQLFLLRDFWEHSMPPPTGTQYINRGWFQLHFSTLVFGVLTAGIMLSLNILPYENGHWLPIRCVRLPPPGSEELSRGWPFTYWNWCHTPQQAVNQVSEWYLIELGVDFLASLGIVVALALLFEAKVRVRKIPPSSTH